MYIGDDKNSGNTRACPLGVADPKHILLPQMYYLPNFVSLGQVVLVSIGNRTEQNFITTSKSTYGRLPE